MFPISRDPPEGGTVNVTTSPDFATMTFPISRDPPEGGTVDGVNPMNEEQVSNF